MQISNQEEDDMISQLPDDVLISIISLIPTKEALTTRILSKRWSHLFQFMSDLTFVPKRNYACTCNSDESIIGVHKVLQRHSAYVRSFVFRYCLPDSCAHTIEQCVFSLGDLGIQKLSLSLLCHAKCIKIPFSCHLLSLMPSLQYFKLAYGSLLPSLESPCNSLKTLRLSHVRASPGSLECILSNCSSLCTLTLKGSIIPSKLCFPRLNLQLKCISIHDCPDLEEIDFYAANLTTFDLSCQREVNLIFDYVPQLQTVRLCSEIEDVPYFCGRLAKYLPTLKTLLLDDIGDLCQDGSIAMGKNMFSNLKRLELSVYVSQFNLFSLIRVLHECPRLEEFKLGTMAQSYEWPEEEKQVILVLSQLKVVEISGFAASESEVGFVAYILRSTVELQKMIISFYKSQHKVCDKWVVYRYPPTYRKIWSEVYECIQQIKHEAVSKTLQLVAQEFPHRKSELF